MAVNFPDSPVINQSFTAGGNTWYWTGVYWRLMPVSVVWGMIPGNISNQTDLINLISAGNTNIYNTNGTLTGNRVVTMGSNTLTFLGTGAIFSQGRIQVGDSTYTNADTFAVVPTATQATILLGKLQGSGGTAPSFRFLGSYTNLNNNTAYFQIGNYSDDSTPHFRITQMYSTTGLIKSIILGASTTYAEGKLSVGVTVGAYPSLVTPPTHELEVTGTSRISVRLLLGYTTTNTDSYTLDVNGNIRNVSGNNFLNFTSGNTYIGYNALPASTVYKLDVNGSVRAIGQHVIQSNIGGGDIFLTIANQSGTSIGTLTNSGLLTWFGTTLFSNTITFNGRLATSATTGLSITGGSVPPALFESQIMMLVAAPNNDYSSTYGLNEQGIFLGGTYNGGQGPSRLVLGPALYYNNSGIATNVWNFTITSTSGQVSDGYGSSLILAGGRGRGTGTPGKFIIQTSTATTTGTTLQTLNNRLEIDGTGQLTLNNYTSISSFVGTAVGLLAFDSAGKIIPTALATGSVTGSGTAGQVTYWSGTSAVSGDNNFIWNSASIRLGIGRSPAARRLELQVANGSVASALGIYDGVGTLNTIFGIDTASSTDFQIASIQGIRFYAGSTLGNIVTNPTNERMRLFASTGNLMLQNGGTFTDGGQRLQVIGDAFIKGSGNTSATFALMVQNGDGTNMLRVRNDNTIYINANTNFGLVQFYPVNNGLYNLASNATELRIESTFINGTTTGDFGYSLGTFSAHNTSNSNPKGLVVISSFSPTSGTQTFTNTLLNPTINQTGGANGITRGLYVNPTLTAAADFRAIETTAGNVLFGSNFFWDNTNGRLGIGTNAPATTLDIKGSRFLHTAATTTSATTLYQINDSNSANHTYAYFGIDITGGTTFFNVPGAYISISRNGGGQTRPLILHIYDSQPIIFANNNLERARFSNNGNLLLNTTTDAGQRLQVIGSMRVGTTAASAMYWDDTNARLGIGTSSPNSILNLVNSFNGTTSLNISNTTSGTASESRLALFSSNGQVQFGKYSSTTTTYKTMAATDAYLYNSTGNISILNDAASGNINFAAGGSSTAHMTISSTGNVGIGTSSPTNTLHVVGNGYFNSNVVTFAGTGGTTVGISTTANFLFDAVATAGNIAWYSQGTLSMIMPGGNTGLNIFPSAANENNTTAEVRVTTRKRVNGNIYQAAAATNITGGGATTGAFAATGTYGLDAINNLNGAFVSGVRIAESFTAIASNQNAAYAGFTFVSTINQSTSVGLTAITRGLYINPTLTSVVDFRAIETTIGKVVLSNTNHTATTLSVTNDNSSLATTTYGISSSATAPGASTVYGIYGTSIGGQTGYGGYFYANANGPANRTYTGVYGVAGNYNTNTTATGGYFQVDGGSYTAGTYIGVVSNVVSSAVSPAVSRLFEGRLGGVAKFYVDTTGNGWFNGAVGIGSTTLNSTLVVNGSQSIGASYATTAAPTNGLIVQGNVGVGISNPSFQFQAEGVFRIGTSTYGLEYSGTSITLRSGNNLAIQGSTNGVIIGAGVNSIFHNVGSVYLNQSFGFSVGTLGNPGSLSIVKRPTQNTNITTTANATTTITTTAGSINSGTYKIGKGDIISLSSAPTTYAVAISVPSGNTSIGTNIPLGDGTSQTFNYFPAIFTAFDNSGNVAFIVDAFNRTAIGQISATASLDVVGSTTSTSSLRIRSGTAPTTPNDGDIWYDGTDFYGRVGATTKSFTAGGGGGVTVSNYSPTVTAVTNVSSATIDHSSVYYISYNGEAYEVWGQVTMTPTAALTTTGFRITLPALSGGGIYPEVLSGSFTSSDGAVGRIYFGYPTDAAYFESVPPSTVSRTYSFRFIYKVIPL